MKQCGFTYADIGLVMGISRQAAQKLVTLSASAMRKARENHGNKCDRCGKRYRALDGHHADYKNPDGIIFLCKRCHKIVDPAKEFFDRASALHLERRKVADEVDVAIIGYLESGMSRKQISEKLGRSHSYISVRINKKFGNRYNVSRKLSPGDIRDIRTARVSGMPCKDIAIKFGVSVPLVYKILSGASYRDVIDSQH